MKSKLWLLQLPFVFLFTFAYYVEDLGVSGKLDSYFLREELHKKVLHHISTAFTDWKFRFRGVQPPKSKVVLVAVDSQSLADLGRWPWHRDTTAALVDGIFKAGAKVVGMDIVFSEPDPRVPEELSRYLDRERFDSIRRQAETDPMLGRAIEAYSDRLALGWTPDQNCQPLYSKPEDCPIKDPQVIKSLVPPDFEKFAYAIQSPVDFDWSRTPIFSAFTVVPNIPRYNAVARHAGYFYATPDNDGVIRKTPLVVLANGRAYPSLPLEMARMIKDDALRIKLDSEYRVAELGFVKANEKLPVTPVGAAEINWRGPGGTFPYVSAEDVIQFAVSGGRAPASSVDLIDMLKDAYAIVGVTAVGVYDLRANPFDSYLPGTEGMITILDNVLAGDFITQGSGWLGSGWLYVLMVVGGILFAFAVQKLEAVPALVLTLAVFGGFGVFDLKILFAHNINWNTGFLFIEFFSIFVFTVAAKYVMEERNKKFVRTAFAKYVAPAVVDSILKDPAKLQVGGEKKDLTILFSDIRGFTTFSERMDAKALSAFLNDYLGTMTKIVFAHHGTLDKYIGDAIMAFWGAPLDQPAHARNACTAAVEMMRALGAHHERWKGQYGVDVAVGIGLNTGAVSVGNMGSDDNFAYTVIGDHVNLASRLEGLTKHYGAGIVTTRFTFDSIRESGAGLPAHRVLDFVKVKGKKNAVELIQVFYRDIPKDGLQSFEEARRFYQQRKWDDAIALFREANRLIMAAEKASPARPGVPNSRSTEMDGPSSMYIERCRELKSSPPGEDWDGSWEMRSK